MGCLCEHGKLKCRKCKGRGRKVHMSEIVTEVEATARIARRINCRRQDCTYPGCQLSLGHPPPHCVGASTLEARRPASGAEYWMVDDNGTVLRRI
jgi:hypothetical protein